MARIPKWAQDLVIQVALDEGREDLPDVNWRRSSIGLRSSGQTSRDYTKVTVTAGENRLDQKLVLLHELAHWLTQNFHTATFWDKAWQLYRRYGIPVRYAKAREGTYMKGALVAYRRNRREQPQVGNR